MKEQGNITKLRTSWTKYDSVQFIEIIGANDLRKYLVEEKHINEAVLKSYLGINDLDISIPNYWIEIQKFKKQKRLFALCAGIFTHYKNIKMFAETFSKGNMKGAFEIGEGDKHMTNLRSALVVSGAAQNSYRKKEIVPYDLSPLFEEDKIGLFFKQLLEERLLRVGYNKKHIEVSFLQICLELDFHKALSLSTDQFTRWIEGKKILPMKEFNLPLEFQKKYQNIYALKVDQWLDIWNDIEFNDELRKKPLPYFFIFKIDVRLLKRLADVHRRRANKSRIEDPNIQRVHEEKRSKEIREYVKNGFPWSTLSENEKTTEDYSNLKMPGMLPTSIIVNILGPKEKRGNLNIRDEDLVKFENNKDGDSFIKIPKSVFDNEWDPELKPIEVIDGQHRLLAFNENDDLKGNYEIPVVAFYNLDRTWQAYLFYVINIKPKKINISLGYDLYPLLRTQKWLESTNDGLRVYRETRAQELVEALWLYEESPWYNNINMIGINEGANISQASFIRALTNSYFRKSKGRIGGLFNSTLPDKNNEEIKWIRAQQAAFLILLWEQIAIAASESKNKWAIKLKNEEKELYLLDTDEKDNSSKNINDAFLSKNSMLSRDQGVTGILLFTNDLFFVAANSNDYDFNSLVWEDDIDEKRIEISSIDKAIDQFRNHSIIALINEVAAELMSFDWRLPSASFDRPEEKENQKKYKGSGGYSDMRADLLSLFKVSKNKKLRAYAVQIEEVSN